MSDRPCLGLLVSFRESDWSAGPVYLRNVVYALRRLPPERQPRIRLLFAPEFADDREAYASLLPLLDGVDMLDPARHQADLLFPCLGGIEPAPPGVRIGWIPDLQHKHLPRLFKSAELAARDANHRALLHECALVVFSSRTALDDARRHYPPEGGARAAGFVLPFRSAAEESWLAEDPAPVLARYGLAEPYLMCCNQFWEHKDHLTLFRALARWNKSRPAKTPCRLLCTGNAADYRNPAYFPRLQAALEALKLKDLVSIVGFLPRQDQIQLMRASLAVVQPSLFEGWSTVLEDARMLGKTVVYSDLPVHLEQDPPYGFAFKAGDAGDLARALDEACALFAPTQFSEREASAQRENAGLRLEYGEALLRMMDEALAAGGERGVRGSGSPAPGLHEEGHKAGDDAAGTPVPDAGGITPKRAAAASFPMTWEQAVTWLKAQPGEADLVRACYFDDPLLGAAERYYEQAEWQALRTLLPSPPGACLDLGAGRGISAYALAREGWRVTALDPDPGDITGAGAVAALSRESGLPITVALASGEAMPFADAAFDVVHARQALHHAADLDALCAEVFRVLRPGGLFLALREHVVDDAAGLDLFLRGHPLHRLYGGENAFPLIRYLQALQGAGFALPRIVNTLESPINYFPLSREQAEERAARLLGAPRTEDLNQEAMRRAGFLLREPGRLFSFVSRRPLEGEGRPGTGSSRPGAGS